MAPGIPERPDFPVDEARARLKTQFTGPPSSHGQQWDNLWKENFIPWDRRAPNPALADALRDRAGVVGRSTGEGQRRRNALVPGCGRGYDVYLLAAHGWDAVGLEVSAEAVRSAEEIRGAVEGGEVEGYEVADPEVGRGSARFVVGDFFAEDWCGKLGLGAKGSFGLIYDYTFLCALPLDLRPQWARTMSRLLNATGRLVCLEFPLAKDPKLGGPPYAIRSELYLALFQKPGENIEYDEDGMAKHDPAVSHRGTGALERIAHWRPDRTHEVGKGHDMISVWRHID